MFSGLLPTLLLASTVSTEITCYRGSQIVPSTASCDVALQNLARFLLPCLGKETVEVGIRGTNADIQFPAIFADKSDYPTKTPRCLIEFFWYGLPEQYQSIQPGQLQTFATNMKDQCIAASPPQLGKGKFEPNRWIYVMFEGVVSDGNLTIPGVNGTLSPVNPWHPPVNPRDACGSGAEPLYEVDLDSPQPSVETS